MSVLFEDCSETIVGYVIARTYLHSFWPGLFPQRPLLISWLSSNAFLSCDIDYTVFQTIPSEELTFCPLIVIGCMRWPDISEIKF